MGEDIKGYDFDLAKSPQTIIKAVGVGGGGDNAVSNMYRAGIRDVSFVICNTDNQALLKSEVPNKLLLGFNTTHGLGSGNVPEKGREAATESTEDIKKMLSDGTRMTFITAGMGGGTGTGAGPVVAQISKEMGILTVGIVTIPFLLEGDRKIIKALKGVREMAKNVDSLIVINNQSLLVGHEDLTMPQAYRKVDETLTIAAKSIAEIITTDLEQNVDFADVDTTMRNSSIALVSVGYGEGEGRLKQAIEDAVTNTLADRKEYYSYAQRVAFVVYYSHENELRISEMRDLHDFMDNFKTDYEVKWGHGYDDTLGDKIKITLIMTGFSLEDVLSLEMMKEANTIEEQEKIAEIEKEKQKEKDLIHRYYGAYLGNRKDPEIRILSIDELDDDSVISAMEEYPTYSRKLAEIPVLYKGGDVPMRTQSGSQRGSSFRSFSSMNNDKRSKQNGRSKKISFRD